MAVGHADVTLPGDVVDFIAGGVSIVVGTRSPELRPEVMRASGVLIDPDGTAMRLLLSDELAARTLANLRAGSPIAIAFNRPIDHRTIQIKGAHRAIRPGTPDEAAAAEHYRMLFADALYLVGMPRSLVRRLRVTPTIVVEVCVHELFHQTPGPGAGSPLPS